MSTVIVTGGAGFIGANFVRYLLGETDSEIVIVDKLTYAGNLASLSGVKDDARVRFVEADITDRPAMESVFRTERPTAIVNFAAESHVDRSIDNPQPFIETNIVGTFVLLEVTRQAPQDLTIANNVNSGFCMSQPMRSTARWEAPASSPRPRHTPPTLRTQPPRRGGSPRACLSRDLPLADIADELLEQLRPVSVSGKTDPAMILNAVEGKKLPIYGDGANVRDWLYVEDHCAGLNWY
jgi:dTDP-glucose 4,6-dehydratase